MLKSFKLEIVTEAERASVCLYLRWFTMMGRRDRAWTSWLDVRRRRLIRRRRTPQGRRRHSARPRSLATCPLVLVALHRLRKGGKRGVGTRVGAKALCGHLDARTCHRRGLFEPPFVPQPGYPQEQPRTRPKPRKPLCREEPQQLVGEGGQLRSALVSVGPHRRREGEQPRMQRVHSSLPSVALCHTHRASFAERARAREAVLLPQEGPALCACARLAAANIGDRDFLRGLDIADRVDGQHAQRRAPRGEGVWRAPVHTGRVQAHA